MTANPNHIKLTYAAAIEAATRHGRSLTAALNEARRLDSRGLPRTRDANSGGNPTGGHSDPTAAHATAGMPGAARRDPFDGLYDDIAKAVADLDRAATRLNTHLSLALANADPAKTCQVCGAQSDKKPLPLRSDRTVRACRRCYDKDRPDRRHPAKPA